MTLDNYAVKTKDAMRDVARGVHGEENKGVADDTECNTSFLKLVNRSTGEYSH